jgi:hypothetical protein
MCSEALPLLLPSSSPLFVGRRLSISSFLPQFRRLLPLLISVPISDLRHGTPNLAGTFTVARQTLRRRRDRAGKARRHKGARERNCGRRSMELMCYATDGLNLTVDIYIWQSPRLGSIIRRRAFHIRATSACRRVRSIFSRTIYGGSYVSSRDTLWEFPLWE